MQFDVITIFPEMVRCPLDFGIVKRAGAAGIIDVVLHDLRDYTRDRHRQVDDRPFGGGAGMVMKPEPLFRAVESIKSGAEVPVILLSPQGRLFNQNAAAELARRERLILICGRYEGVDERVVEAVVDDEISIGDYVLSGGELPALVVIDAVTRLLPGALGCDASAEQESFSREGSWEGLLDFPQYTRPASFRGLAVPEVLLGGNHGEIERWRRRKAIEKTLRRRPDLLQGRDSKPGERAEIEQIEAEICAKETD